MNKTPKLRFKEFSDGLKASKGNELFTILGGAAFSSKDAKCDGIKWFKIANVGINTTDKREISYLPSKLLDDYSRYVLSKGDITLALTRPILNSKLKVCIIDDFFEGSLLNQRVGKVITKDNAHKKFIYYLIQTEGNIRYLENMIAGTDPPNLSNSDLLMREYNVPSKEEQEKIASFFSLIDDKISLQGEKVEMLKSYKKGMMQKIFSMELRFKGFSKEWNTTTLGEVTNSFEYGMNAAATEFDGENKYIRITDIDESTSKYINKNIVSPLGKLEDKYLVKENDILFARTGASTGKTYIYDTKDENLYFAGFLIKANVNSNNSSKFIFFQTKTKEYEKWVKIMSMRSGQPGINAKEYASYSFLAPSKEEQEKIGDFLMKIDKKIDNEMYKLESLNEYKKGLLQQMFI